MKSSKNWQISHKARFQVRLVRLSLIEGNEAVDLLTCEDFKLLVKVAFKENTLDVTIKSLENS